MKPQATIYSEDVVAIKPGKVNAEHRSYSFSWGTGPLVFTFESLNANCMLP